MWCCWVTCSRPSAFSSSDPLFIVSGLHTSGKPFRHNTTCRFFFPFSQIWFPYLSRVSFFFCSPHTIWLWKVAIHLPKWWIVGKQSGPSIISNPKDVVCCVSPQTWEFANNFCHSDCAVSELELYWTARKDGVGFQLVFKWLSVEPNVQSGIYVLMATKNWSSVVPMLTQQDFALFMRTNFEYLLLFQ